MEADVLNKLFDKELLGNPWKIPPLLSGDDLLDELFGEDAEAVQENFQDYLQREERILTLAREKQKMGPRKRSGKEFFRFFQSDIRKNRNLPLSRAFNALAAVVEKKIVNPELAKIEALLNKHETSDGVTRNIKSALEAMVGPEGAKLKLDLSPTKLEQAIMIYQKERPRIFDDVLGQEYIVENIRNQSVSDSWFNVYILAGQYGSGKTSMGYVIARAANCQHRDERGNPCLKCEHCLGIQSGGLDFWEIDGADNSSVEDIRKLKEYISFYPTKQKWKVVIIDEVHMLSKSAFNCLLKLLETPPPYVIIILCTTDLFAIPITVRSRAATYRFTRIPHQDIMKGLRRAAPKYEITLDESACSLIAHYSDGSMRNAYMLLEQVSVVTKQIDEAACMAVLGIVDEEGINAIISILYAGEVRRLLRC